MQGEPSWLRLVIARTRGKIGPRPKSRGLHGDGSTRGEGGDGLEGAAEWRVDRSRSSEHLRGFRPAVDRMGQWAGGALIYTDEKGAQRRLPEDMSALSNREIAGVARATSYELGAVEPSYARLAAIERLNELRSAGTISEETYLREKRRISELG